MARTHAVLHANGLAANDAHAGKGALVILLDADLRTRRLRGDMAAFWDKIEGRPEDVATPSSDANRDASVTDRCKGSAADHSRELQANAMRVSARAHVAVVTERPAAGAKQSPATARKAATASPTSVISKVHLKPTRQAELGSDAKPAGTASLEGGASGLERPAAAHNAVASRTTLEVATHAVPTGAPEMQEDASSVFAWANSVLPGCFSNPSWRTMARAIGRDSTLLCRLVAASLPDLLDERAINTTQLGEPERVSCGLSPVRRFGYIFAVPCSLPMMRLAAHSSCRLTNPPLLLPDTPGWRSMRQRATGAREPHLGFENGAIHRLQHRRSLA